MLAGVPVLLHLMMRAKPKRVVFPALMLIKARKASNSRRMRLRQILLLVLRTIVVAVGVLALTRPSLPAARYGLRWYEWIILAVVIAAAFAAYQWLGRKADSSTAAEHQRRDKRTKLRMWTLLAGLAAVLLGVGLPWGMRVSAELSSPNSPVTESVPVAAVFVFDTSLSMTYRHESKTRLEQAVELATTQLSELPTGSRVAVATTHPDSESVFQADLAGVRSRMADLKTNSVPQSLNRVLKSAIESQITDRDIVQTELSGNDMFAREIYLLTDLSQAAWNEPDESGLKDLLKQHDWLTLYVIDVSVLSPKNIALQGLKLDRHSTVAGRPVQVSVAVDGGKEPRPPATLELVMLSEKGDEVSGGVEGSPRAQVEFGGSPTVKTFNVIGTPGAKSQQGFVRLATADPMPFDDARYFTFSVRRVPRVLMVGRRLKSGLHDTWYLENALQPVQAERNGFGLRYKVKSIDGRQFSRERLGAYDIVCLVNWTSPPLSAWTELQRYVEGGGAAFIVAGGEKTLDPDSYTSNEAGTVLPAVPLLPQRFKGDPGQLSLTMDAHPICKPFVEFQEARTKLSQAFFEQCWACSEPEDGVNVIMSYNDAERSPALMERSMGQGKVIMFTSAIDNARDWNENFINNEPWATLMLFDELMQYLTGATSEQRNFDVGDPVDIAVPQSRRFGTYRVSRPQFRMTEGEFPIDETSILLTDATDAGQYRLKSADPEVAFVYEFSVNPQDNESDLTPITDERLEELLGPERFTRVRSTQELDRAVNLGRLGVKVFPVLMGLLVLLFCAEHLMSHFFYDTSDGGVRQESAAG